MKKYFVLALASFVVGNFTNLSYAASATPPNPSTDQIQQLNTQIQGQLKQVQTQQQQQIEKLNTQVQTQLKQMQSQLQDQIQKLNAQTQDQIKQLQSSIKELQTNLQQQIKQVQQQQPTPAKTP